MTSKDIIQTFRFLVLCLILLALFSLLDSLVPSQKSKKPSKLTYVPQFVLISFDGSKAIDTWQDLRQFKSEMKEAGKPINFTHFINAAYFLTEDTKQIYKGPGHEIGKTNIGLSEDLDHVKQRIEEVNLAVADGDEIAPHTVGHFSGLKWSKDEWKEELDSFDRIMFGLDAIYPDAHLPKLLLKREDIIGFRAPYLDRSAGLYEMLHADKRYLYDTSEVGPGDDWPMKDSNGLWHIPLGTLYIVNKKPVLAMDYNLYVFNSQAKNTIKKGTPEWQKDYDEMYAAWLDYFNGNYSTNRAPVLVGYHFSMKWNDGLYWEVMKGVAREVCGKPQVRCGTFKELVSYLNQNGAPVSTKVKSMTASAGDILAPVGPELELEHEHDHDE